MKKAIFRSLAFLLIFALLFTGFTFLLVPKSNTTEAGMHDAWAKGFYAEPENSIDVLVLGDSELYSCIVPLTIWENQGIPTYTCGTSDQKPYQTETYLRRAFQSQSPKLVILETNVFYRDYSTTDVIPHIFEELFPLVRYHDRWKSLKASDFTDPIAYNKPQRDKGYLYLVEIQSGDDSDYMAYSEDMDPIPAKSLRHVRRMVRYCRERGAEVLFLSSPSIANWDYSRHNAVAQLAEALEVPYIDANLMREEIPIDWQVDTRDGGDHLNHTGAVKLSTWLGEYLAGTGLFEDKRDWTSYTPWNEALANFRRHAD